MHALNSEHAQSDLFLSVDSHWLELVGYAHYCVCVHTLGRAYFKATGVKDSVPDMIEIDLIDISIKNGIVYPDEDGFFYGPG